MPLKITLEQKGDTTYQENTSGNKFQLVCNTNMKNTVENQILWIKDDKEIFIDESNKMFTSLRSPNGPYANSILEFKAVQNRQFDYSGVYRCKIHIRYPDVGQGGFYLSEAKPIGFNYYGWYFILNIISRNEFKLTRFLLFSASKIQYNYFEYFHTSDTRSIT